MAWHDVASQFNDRINHQNLLNEQWAKAKPTVAGAEGFSESLHRSLDLVSHNHNELSREARESNSALCRA